MATQEINRAHDSRGHQKRSHCEATLSEREEPKMEIHLPRSLLCPAVYIVWCITLCDGVPIDLPADDESSWVLANPSDNTYYSSSSSFRHDFYSYYSDGGGRDITDGVADEASVESSKSLNRLSSFLYNTHSIRRHGFRQMDADDDGYVTKDEYSLQNPGVDQEIVRTLFNILDSDGDDQLTEEELVSKTEFWDTSEDCEVFAMQQCYGRLTYTVERGNETTDAMCHGLQAYSDCLSSESVFCDFTWDFVHAVYTFADSYKSTRLCENLIIQELANFAEWDSNSRRKLSSATGNTGGDSGPLECASLELGRCTVLFTRSLREEGNFCSTLGEYRHCINHAARNCEDETLQDLKESVMVLTRLHKQFQVCDFN